MIMDINLFEIIIPVSIFLIGLFASTIFVLAKDFQNGSRSDISNIFPKILMPIIPIIVSVGTYFLIKYFDKVYLQIDGYMYIISSIVIILIFLFVYLTGIFIYEEKGKMSVILSPIHFVFTIGTYLLISYLNVNYFLLESYISIIITTLFAIIYYSIIIVIADFNASDVDDHFVSFLFANVLSILASGGLITIFSIATKNYNNAFLIFYPVIFVIMLIFPIINFTILFDGLSVEAEDVAIPCLIFDLILEVGLLIAYGVLIITVFTAVWAFCFIPFALAVGAIIGIIVFGLNL